MKPSDKAAQLVWAAFFIGLMQLVWLNFCY